MIGMADWRLKSATVRPGCATEHKDQVRLAAHPGAAHHPVPTGEPNKFFSDRKAPLVLPFTCRL